MSPPRTPLSPSQQLINAAIKGGAGTIFMIAAYFVLVQGVVPALDQMARKAEAEKGTAEARMSEVKDLREMVAEIRLIVTDAKIISESQKVMMTTFERSSTYIGQMVEMMRRFPPYNN